MGLQIGSLVGPYEIVSAIAAGGMGEVYRARDARLRRDVAIKVLPDSFSRDVDRAARFEREARLLAALNCPSIGSIYGIEEVDGRYGLVLELIEGPTLAERLKEGPLEVREALHIARQIVDALDAAHEKGIVHRDLKPANIKITSDGIVKVLDFGLAKGADEAATPDLSQSPTVTADGTLAGLILGTASYMSPEQARGRVVDRRADIWAFGCVLYEMLTGRLAFPGETVSDVIAKIISSEPDWSALPPTTPPHLRRLLPRLLHRDLKPRIRDIGDVRFDLDEPLAGGGSGEPSSASHTVRRWRAIALGSLALAVAAAVIAAGWRAQRDPASPIAGQTIVSQLTNYDGSEAWAAIAPDGRSFVFVSNHGGTPDIWLRQVSGGDPVRLTNDTAVESHLVFAPNGDTVYFTRADGTDTSIWRIGTLGGQSRKVLNNAQAPSPSRDGARLAWYAPEPGGGFALSVGAADGGGSRILVPKVLNVAGATRAAWSPDGRLLAYTVGALFAARNLFVVDVADGRVTQVTHFDKSGEGPHQQEWLPDGRHLVVSYIAGPRVLGSWDVGVLDVETGSIVRLTANVDGNFIAPSISFDGMRVVATARRFERELWKVPLGPDPLANGRGAVRLLDGSLDPMWASVTRDGRTLLFNNAVVGSRNLWTKPLDGSATPRQITTVPGDAVMHSSLSPDASHVVYASNTTGNADVWVQNVDGTDLRQLTDDPAADAWPVWSPDGRSIMFSSLFDGKWETKRIAASGGPAEKVVDGFFRGDWIRKPDGTGTLMVTTGEGLRVVDVERRSVVWQDSKFSGALPMFNADGTAISIAYPESRDRDAIWVYDVATGKGRVAVRFPQPFHILFRASWVDEGRAFVVNRQETPSHIVMFDHFWTGGGATAR